MNQKHIDLTPVVIDNESAVARAFAEKNYVQAFLLIHALIESLLRAFLGHEHKDDRFYDLIEAYKKYLSENNYSFPTFVTELSEFNRRRNRITHKLWVKGYSETNRQSEAAAHTASVMYGLFIEWLQTFEPKIVEIGFRLSEDG